MPLHGVSTTRSLHGRNHKDCVRGKQPSSAGLQSASQLLGKPFYQVCTTAFRGVIIEQDNSTAASSPLCRKLVADADSRRGWVRAVACHIPCIVPWTWSACLPRFWPPGRQSKSVSDQVSDARTRLSPHPPCTPSDCRQSASKYCAATRYIWQSRWVCAHRAYDMLCVVYAARCASNF